MYLLQRYFLIAAALCLLYETTFGIRVGLNSKKVGDQSTSASWWHQDSVDTLDLHTPDQFSSTHGLVQTHPSQRGRFGSKQSGRIRNGQQYFQQSSLSNKIFLSDPTLSTPQDCARACREGEPPKICYYHFTLELYTVLGGACQVCTPNATNTLQATCQCVLADGVERTFISVNRMLPGPTVQVCEGDKVVADVTNHIEGNEVTIHWHGVFQRGSQYYDGVPFVTQCPIHQGNTFRYQWTAGNAGTHFWHAHTGLQKLDGVYGSIVIRQPPSKDPNSYLYDYDLTTHVMLISDWMHEESTERFPGRLAVNVGQSADSLLINGKGQFRDPNTGFMTNTPLEVFSITAGKRYRFRMINSFATVCPAQLTIEGHDLRLIAVDGEAVRPVVVNTIISFSGERYDFVIDANQSPGAYWIQLRALGECGINRVQQLGILRYTRGPYVPNSPAPTYDVGLPQGVVLNPLDALCQDPRPGALCISDLKSAGEIDKEVVSEDPAVKIFLPFRFLFYPPDQIFMPNTYYNYIVSPVGTFVLSLIDEISYTSAPSPLISQYDDIDPSLFCNGDNRPADCQQNCTCVHKIDIPLNAMVEIVIVDEVQQPNLSHPFHLHGTNFYVMGMGRSPDKNVKKINLKHTLDLDRQGLLKRDFNYPPRKDTISVPNNGYVVLRFNAVNPGFWLMHCHFLYHIAIGMQLVLHVGTLQDLPPVPKGFPRCGDFSPPITPPYSK